MKKRLDPDKYLAGELRSEKKILAAIAVLEDFGERIPQLLNLDLRCKSGPNEIHRAMVTARGIVGKHMENVRKAIPQMKREQAAERRRAKRRN